MPKPSQFYSLELHIEDDHMWATIEELPGLFVTAESFEELSEALAEALGLYFGTKLSPTVKIEHTKAERVVPARLELVPC